MTRRNNQRGLTLIETLVALAIMGLVAASVLTLIGQSTRFAADVRQRAYAEIALDNVMVETLVRSEALSDEESGEIIVNGRRFVWTRTIIETGVDGVQRIDVQIKAPGGVQNLARASTLRGTR